jgi:hypothetical protein
MNSMFCFVFYFIVSFCLWYWGLQLRPHTNSLRALFSETSSQLN